MRTVFLLGALAAALLAPAHGDPLPPASLKFFLTPIAVAEVQGLINPLLPLLLANVSIPDQSISALGIEIHLTNIYMTAFNFSAESAVFSPPRSLGVTMTGISCKCFMLWDYKDGPAIHFSGSAEDDISDTSLSLALDFSSDGKGHAAISASSVSAKIGNLDIQLHGSGSQFFDLIVKMIKPLLVDIAQNAIASAMKSVVDTTFADILAAIPTSVPLTPANLELDFGLVPTTAAYGMQGTYYSNNHFSGDSHGVYYADMSHVSIDNYRSFDVTGYFTPPYSGQFQFEIHYTQRGRVDVAGLSAGSLEMHNPGMCWPEHSTHSTGYAYFNASSRVPLRLRYQSGCGGGWIELNLCDPSKHCVSVLPNLLTTENVYDVPLSVWPFSVVVSSVFGIRDRNANDSVQHHVLPSNFSQVFWSNQSFGIALDEYVINSALWVFAERGYLNFTVLPSMVPPSSPFQLNTTSLKLLFPDLWAAYPDDLIALDLFATPDSPPLVTFSPSLVSLSSFVRVNLSVLLNQSSDPSKEHLVGCLGVQVDAVATADVRVANPTLPTSAQLPRPLDNVTYELWANISSLHLNFSVIWSSVRMNVEQLNPLVNAIVSQLVVPALNKRLNAGLPLGPLPLIEIKHPRLQLLDHYLAVGADVGLQHALRFLYAYPWYASA